MNKAMIVAVSFLLTGLCPGLTEEHLEITGRVQDALARHVEGAEVAVLALSGDGFNDPKSVRMLKTISTTDKEGRFAFDLWVEPRRDILVVARKSGLALGWDYICRKRPLEAKPGRRQTVHIVLQTPNGIAGRLMDVEGKAVVGANVQVVPYIRNGGKDVYAPRDWLSTQTDVQGHFIFDSLQIDAEVKFHVEIARSDIVYIYPPEAKLGNASGGYRVDEEDVELRLPSGATVQGTVLDRGTGQGIEGIRLLLYSDPLAKASWSFRSVTLYSGVNGRFEIKGVPPGGHILRVIAPETGRQAWVARHVIINVDRSQKSIEAKVLIEKGRPLEVLVRDKATGSAVPGVNVQVDDRWDLERNDVFVQVTKTDARGIARLVVPQEKLKIHAFGNNYADGLKEKGTRIDMTSSRRTPVEVLVRPDIPLVKGIVVDTLAQPVEHVLVTIGGGQSVLTDSQGRFAGRQNPLYPSHLVVARDVKRDLVGMSFFHSALRELRVVLKPGSAVRGRVTDELGRGIPGAQVHLSLDKRMRRRTDPFASAQMTYARTDTEGYYCLDNVMPLQGDYYYNMHVRAADFGPTSHMVEVEMKPGDVIANPDMRLLALDASISGVVLDQRGKPVAHKSVHAASDTGGSKVLRSSYTDEQGRFKFKRMAEGLVSLGVGVVSDPDHTRVTAHSGDHVKIVLGDGGNEFVLPSAMVGFPLPDLRELEIGFDYRRIRHKKAMVFFVDYAQRPCQLEIRYLNTIRHHLRRHGIELICIQVTPVNEAELKAWKRENRIAIPIKILPGDAMGLGRRKLKMMKNPPESENALREKWGIRSLPWAVLADENQKIMASGFQASHIFQVVPPENRQSSPLRRTRRRR